MGKRYLIDTNVLLEFVAGLLPPDVHKFVEDTITNEFNISVINRIEILGHSSGTSNLINFLGLANQFELSTDVVNQTISIRKILKIKLPDAIIAGTALH